MKQFFAALAAVCVMASAPAFAAPTFCSPGPNADGLAVTDVSVNSIDASSCFGVVEGNDDAAAVNSIGWGSFALAARDNVGSNSDTSNVVDGIAWSLTADPGKAGDFVLSGIDTNGSEPANLGGKFSLLLAFKASDGYSLYSFNDIVLFGSNAGEYVISFLNNGGQNPDLSHVTAYLRTGDVTVPIPEPSTYALMLAGLGAVGLVARRKSKK